ncbi:hypothetical protein CCR94_12440 [Rhodoblastus sphagnicola]|uniref:Cell division protein ZapA n=1 Tax=Rhodoblastus sphagnicola TaxID=333368 RepID=A0A2S6N758_9HYPH|nr:cell division protein ZapA [Rhodoblastus sphagnicola]MBB4197413.1 cell division protein ZapA [Rhodoblastus sphagnicola]PPQ30443.1 hypothetical protein CCR94_12440 [Rhodoblastus sphagnicola]
MAQAVVTIAGRTYRMNCEEGEQPHIENLARSLEARIGDLRGAFGEIGEQRIVVMAAISLADELHVAQKQLAEAKVTIETGRAEAGKARLRELERAEWAAKTLDKATAKVAAATRALNES